MAMAMRYIMILYVKSASSLYGLPVCPGTVLLPRNRALSFEFRIFIYLFEL